MKNTLSIRRIVLINRFMRLDVEHANTQTVFIRIVLVFGMIQMMISGIALALVNLSQTCLVL